METPLQAQRIRELEQRLAAMPGSRLFVQLAEEYRRAGRFENALTTLQEGLALHPTYLSAQIAVGRLYQEMGRRQEAIDAFLKVLGADRENLVAARCLVELYEEEGNPVEAVKKLKLYRGISGDRSVDEQLSRLEEQIARTPAPSPFAEPAPMPEAVPMPEAAPLLPPVPVAEPDVVVPASKVLADLYRQQGHLEEANRIYERLQEAPPLPTPPPPPVRSSGEKRVDALRKLLSRVESVLAQGR